MDKTETPRTDARYVRGFDALRITNDEEQWVRADFARTLERETADLRRQLAALQDAFDNQCRVSASYAEQLAAERGRVVELAYSVKVRGEALAASGDLELSAIGEHYVGIADEIRALSDPQNAEPAGVVVPEYIVERAAQLLESAADFGIQHQWADGSTTPNADACRQTAAALLTAAAKEPKK